MSNATEKVAASPGSATPLERKAAYYDLKRQLTLPEEVAGAATPTLGPERVSTIRRSMMLICFERWQGGEFDEDEAISFADDQAASQVATAAWEAEKLKRASVSA